MDGLKLLIWIVICFSPALFEYRTAFESQGLAQSQGVISSIKNLPSTAIPIPGFVVSEVKYTFESGGKQVEGVQDSLPHLEYFTHVPNDLKDEYLNKPVVVSYKSTDPSKSLVPAIGSSYAIIACLQGALFAIGGSLLGLVFSLAATTYR